MRHLRFVLLELYLQAIKVFPNCSTMRPQQSWVPRRHQLWDIG
ncbi:hypothetical protein CZ774_05175 [Frigoribacterium sp. JB110]|nr:hypothetical protein CZ774_05175 [Frigoribacterium sp. JB110]